MSGAGDEKVVRLHVEDSPLFPVGGLDHSEAPDGLNEFLAVSSKEVCQVVGLSPSPGDCEDRSVLSGKLPVSSSGRRDLMHPDPAGKGSD